MDYKEDALLAGQLLADSIKRLMVISLADLRNGCKYMELLDTFPNETHLFQVPEELLQLKLISNVAGEKMKNIALAEDTTNKTRKQLAQQIQLVTVLDQLFWALVNQNIVDIEESAGKTLHCRRTENESVCWITMAPKGNPFDNIKNILGLSDGPDSR